MKLALLKLKSLIQQDQTDGAVEAECSKVTLINNDSGSDKGSVASFGAGLVGGAEATSTTQ